MEFWSELSVVVKAAIVIGVLVAMGLVYMNSGSEPTADEIRLNDAKRFVHGGAPTE